MITVTCTCGKTYSFDPRHAGRVVKCAGCGQNLRVPAHSGPAEPVAPAATPKPPTVTMGNQGHASARVIPPEASASQPASAGGYGPYTVVRPLAQGGMGRVSVARDEPLRREVALKELLEPAAADPQRTHRFLEEARITGRLEHPGVVPIYALGMDRLGRPFYAMRLVHGKTLKEAIDQHYRGPTPAGLRELLRGFVAVCQTAAYAHARGVIHRDLKPSNVMLGEYGETLILDWGLARPVEDRGSPSSTLGDLAGRLLAGRAEATAPGGRVGTPPYMAPEQAAGAAGMPSSSADVYGLGAVLYHVLTGLAPYRGASAAEVVEQVKAGPPARPGTVRPGVPRPLEAVCLNAMARQPQQRYPSAAALAQDVQNWLDDEPVGAYREPIGERAIRWARRHKPMVLAGSAALLCAIVAASVGAVLFARARARVAAAESLAEEYAQRAEEALQQADQKEEEARRLASEAAKAREEAAAATQAAAKATEAAGQAKARIGQLEAELKTKADQAQELSRKLEQSRGELASLQAQAAGQSERARAAEAKAKSLEQQAAGLRREGGELRRLASQLAELAQRAQGNLEPRPPASPPPFSDLTEQDATAFDVTAGDKASTTLTSDSSRALSGGRSLRLDSRTAGDVGIAYPRRRNANWDLSKQEYLHLALRTEEASGVLQPGSPRIRIGRGSRHIEYQAPADSMKLPANDWARFTVPLAGDKVWARTEVNGLDLSRVDWIKVHVAAAKPGLRLWLDELEFGPDPNAPPPAVAPFDAAQARQHQEAWAQYLGVPVEITNSIGMKLVLIPPGEFDMGSTQEQVDSLKGKRLPELLASQVPRHRVQITRPFYLGKYEVTVAQFAEFVVATGYKTSAEQDPTGRWNWSLDPATGRVGLGLAGCSWKAPAFAQASEHPVVCVSHDEAVAFCLWLAEADKLANRLPTEAEWEYACRAGTVTLYQTGDSPDALEGYANLADTSLAAAVPSYAFHVSWNDGYPFTAPVAQFKPSSFGLYDMLGNADEFCADLWTADYYRQSPMKDPPGPPSGPGWVARGGAWMDPAWSPGRAVLMHHARYCNYMGFRVAREVMRPEQNSRRVR